MRSNEEIYYEKYESLLELALARLQVVRSDSLETYTLLKESKEYIVVGEYGLALDLLEYGMNVEAQNDPEFCSIIAQIKQHTLTYKQK